MSVFGTESEQRQALEGLKAATPYVRGELGRRLRLRRIPEVVFHHDRSLERGSTVLGLLQQLERERLQRTSEDHPPTVEPATDDADAP